MFVSEFFLWERKCWNDETEVPFVHLPDSIPFPPFLHFHLDIVAYPSWSHFCYTFSTRVCMPWRAGPGAQHRASADAVSLGQQKLRGWHGRLRNRSPLFSFSLLNCSLLLSGQISGSNLFLRFFWLPHESQRDFEGAEGRGCCGSQQRVPDDHLFPPNSVMFPASRN